MKYPILTKQFLIQKYIIEKLSTREIAKTVGCDKDTIRWYLIKYNVLIRTQSEAMEGKHLSEETKRKMRLNHADVSGKNNPMYGKHHSKETKKKISKANKGKYEGENHPNWKGGRTKDSGGYWLKYLPEHPYADHHGYVREHRWVVEQYIGRCLTPKEQVHHINHIKSDNGIENLMVFCCNAAHARYHKNPDSVKSEEIMFDGGKLK